MANGPNGDDIRSRFNDLIAILGAVTGFAALIYALGLVTIFLSLYDKYIESLPTSWYAASLVPRTVVGIYGVKSLLWPAATNTVFVVIVLLMAFRVDRLWHEQPGSSLRRVVEYLVFLLMFPVWFILSIFLPAYDVLHSRFFTWINVENLFTTVNVVSVCFGSYIVVTMLGALLGGLRLYKTRLENDEAGLRIRHLFWPSLIIFGSAYLGAIALAVPREPPLPNVALVEQQNNRDSKMSLQAAWWAINPVDTKQCNTSGLTEDPRAIEGILLAYYEGHWYVLDEDRGDVTVVPADEKGLASVPSSSPERCISRVVTP